MSNVGTKTRSAIIATHLSTSERDLFYRKVLASEDLLLNIPVDMKLVLSKIRNQVDMVVNHLAGETVCVYLDDEDKMTSTITSGKSRYVYVTDYQQGTDDNLFQGSNYKELMLDLIGLFKDGDINIIELYSRNNWNFSTGDHYLDQHTLKWVISSNSDDKNNPTLEAEDKEELGRILDCESDMDTYLDMLSTARVLPNRKIVSIGNITCTVQDRLTGKVIEMYTNDVVEVIDLIINNVLIKLKRT